MKTQKQNKNSKSMAIILYTSVILVLDIIKASMALLSGVQAVGFFQLPHISLHRLIVFL